MAETKCKRGFQSHVMCDCEPTHPLTPREKVARAVYDTVTRFDGDTVGTHLGLSAMIDAAAPTVDDERRIVKSVCDDIADSILTALASGSGDHAELARLAEAATEGPWEWWSSCSHWRLTGADRRDGGVISAIKASDGFPLVVCNEDDRAFIAAARSAVPALIAEVAALRAESENARTVVAWANNSLFGSCGYFHGEPFDGLHLARPIETLKARATEAERKLAGAEARLERWEPKPFCPPSVSSGISKEAERGPQE